MRLIDADALPTADRPTGQWIPVTERLPETARFPGWTKCLTCNKYGEVDTQYWADGWNCSMDHKGNILREHENKDIVAWMPLPEPYKEADDDN